MELVINTFGTSLNRDNEGFVISTAEGRQRVPAEGISSIQISKGAQITFELRFTSFSLGNRKTGFFKEKNLKRLKGLQVGDRIEIRVEVLEEKRPSRVRSWRVIGQGR